MIGNSEEPTVLLREAVRAADAADTRSGIRTRSATEAELGAVLARFEATWGGGRGPDRSMLQALAHAGNTVLVAVPAHSPAEPVEAPDPILGATLGFLGWDGGLHLHSHMNAVDPAQRGRGIGVALKLRQRVICLDHGVTEMRWTYDPLIVRNARMNLVRLGAEVIAYHPDFYGSLGDAITGDDRSDRFEVRWRLGAPRTLRALVGEPQPVWRPADGTTDGTTALALAADFEALRAADPHGAARLRDASRVAFDAIAAGLRPELTADGEYVFTTDDPDREAQR